MRKLSWSVTAKENCKGKMSSTIKIKYKKTIYKVKIPDIKLLDAEKDYDEQFKKGLEEAFGKKKGKKIFKKVINDFSEF